MKPVKEQYLELSNAFRQIWEEKMSKNWDSFCQAVNPKSSPGPWRTSVLKAVFAISCWVWETQRFFFVGGILSYLSWQEKLTDSLGKRPLFCFSVCRFCKPRASLEMLGLLSSWRSHRVLQMLACLCVRSSMIVKMPWSQIYQGTWEPGTIAWYFKQNI